ncbi:tetratricopeptide repeat protein [Rubripirellula amarantea]|nr:hypothetical protein [Rubripirellula amarantea]
MVRKYVLAMLTLMTICGGCRMSTGMHVWDPPQLESAVGKRIGIASVGGDPELAGPIRQKMIAMAPKDSGRGLNAFDPAQLDTQQTIRQVSAIDGQPNDIATASVARSAGLDYLMQGQVLTKHHDKGAKDPVEEVKKMLGQTPNDSKADNPTLSVSWQLTSINDNRHAGGKPVVIDLETAKQRYPDLAMLSDPDEILSTASVREAYRLVTPSVNHERVQLAIPYGLPGSREVRRGNILALAGQWGEAAKVWQAVADEHPLQSAALHNLALAAAASQDFSRAKTLARSAIRRNPAPLHQKTLVWIEQRQRDYHEAFNLPDPPEGWFVSR